MIEIYVTLHSNLPFIGPSARLPAAAYGDVEMRETAAANGLCSQQAGRFPPSTAILSTAKTKPNDRSVEYPDILVKARSAKDGEKEVEFGGTT